MSTTTALESNIVLDNAPQVFEVSKAYLGKTRLTLIDTEQVLANNEVLLKVDKFALTANNISYGVAGDTLGYWRFFPTQFDENNKAVDSSTWGRLPVMGYADVIASNCNEVAIGERVWGFFPMASHVKVLAGKIHLSGFSDISEYREGLAPLYAAFERVSHNPFYNVSNEDFDILLRGLFTTSWLVDDFMYDNNYFNAQQYLITSASSKTSIALAFAIQARGEKPAIGITSSNNKAFVESLGCYDNVVSYDDIKTLDSSIISILVDMAGSQTVLETIHHHFSAQLAYSCRIGMTHHEDKVSIINKDKSPLPGAKPIFFFAPTQFKKRTSDWGAKQVMTYIGSGLLEYISFCRSFMSIAHTQKSEELDGIYQQVLAGTADASVGQIVSL